MCRTPSRPPTRSRVRAAAALLAGLLALLGGALPAAAELMLVPQRLVLEGRERSAVVHLFNRDSEPRTYRIGWRELRQQPDGSFAVLETPGPEDRLASPMIRFAPRQVTLEPGADQVVRLLVRKPPDLPAGEYRSHLLFQADPRPFVDAEAGAVGEGLAIRIDMIYGITIPVIVRHGELTADVRIADATAARGAERLELVTELVLAGERSVYGDLRLIHAPPGGGERVLWQVRGLSILPPNDRRRIRVSVPLPPDVALAPGTLRLVYRLPPEEGEAILAAAPVALR